MTPRSFAPQNAIVRGRRPVGSQRCLLGPGRRRSFGRREPRVRWHRKRRVVGGPVSAVLGPESPLPHAPQPPPPHGRDGPADRPTRLPPPTAPAADAAAELLGGAQAARGARALGEVGAEVELEGGVLDGAGGDRHGLELGEL
jgi:hypothetical protein